MPNQATEHHPVLDRKSPKWDRASHLGWLGRQSTLLLWDLRLWSFPCYLGPWSPTGVMWGYGFYTSTPISFCAMSSICSQIRGASPHLCGLFGLPLTYLEGQHIPLLPYLYDTLHLVPKAGNSLCVFHADNGKWQRFQYSRRSRECHIRAFVLSKLVIFSQDIKGILKNKTRSAGLFIRATSKFLLSPSLMGYLWRQDRPPVPLYPPLWDTVTELERQMSNEDWENWAQWHQTLRNNSAKLWPGASGVPAAMPGIYNPLLSSLPVRGQGSVMNPRHLVLLVRTSNLLMEWGVCSSHRPRVGVI